MEVPFRNRKGEHPTVAAHEHGGQPALEWLISQLVFLDDDEAMEAIWKKQYSLTAFTAPDQFKSYDELKKRLDYVLGNKSTRRSTVEEETEYAANIERATLLQTERQALAEKLQKDAETLSQEEITDMQRDIQEKGKDIEFIVGKVQAKQSETADKVFRDLNPSLQKILSELIAAKEVKLLLGRENVLFADTALDLTDDVTSMLDVAAASGEDNE